MLMLNESQMYVFSQLALGKFKRKAVAHVQKYFPEQCRAMTPEAIQEAVDFAIEQASRYQLFTERDNLRFLTLAFTFGKHFDDDTNYPWAAAILKSKHKMSERTDRLRERALQNRASAQGYHAKNCR